jgi:hypothetical protein
MSSGAATQNETDFVRDILAEALKGESLWPENELT